MLIASDLSCRGWNGKSQGDAYIGGDCTRILGLELQGGFSIKKTMSLPAQPIPASCHFHVTYHPNHKATERKQRFQS
jgi:hypothetical protein